MQVYALVGTSGTGKSYKALFVAKQYEIAYIVDDGLFIKENKKIAGSSAKREHTYISAVKRAIFHHKAHRLEVSTAIKNCMPKKLLIVGTSDAMVEKIAKRLDVGQIYRKIYIEEVSSAQEILTAKEMRTKHGKHVIPVPTIELKGDFSGYFLDKLRLFNLRFGKKTEIVEKSIVRPTFSYLGRYSISNKALAQIVTLSLQKSIAIKRITRVKFQCEVQGVTIEIDIAINLGVSLPSALNQALKKVIEDIESMTQLNVIDITLYIKSVSD